MNSLINWSSTSEVSRIGKWWEAYSKTLESQFFEFWGFFATVALTIVKTIIRCELTEKGYLLHKIKLFNAILASQELALCSRSLEISQIQLDSARNKLESLIFFAEAKLLFYSWNAARKVHPNIWEKCAFHFQNMDFRTAAIFKMLEEKTI